MALGGEDEEWRQQARLGNCGLPALRRLGGGGRISTFAEATEDRADLLLTQLKMLSWPGGCVGLVGKSNHESLAGFQIDSPEFPSQVRSKKISVSN